MPDPTVDVSTVDETMIISEAVVYSGKWAFKRVNFGFLWLDTENLVSGWVSAIGHCGTNIPSHSGWHITGDCWNVGTLGADANYVYVNNTNGQCSIIVKDCGNLAKNRGRFTSLRFRLGTWLYDPSYVGPTNFNTATHDLHGRTWQLTQVGQIPNVVGGIVVSIQYQFRWSISGVTPPPPPPLPTFDSETLPIPMSLIGPTIYADKYILNLVTYGIAWMNTKTGDDGFICVLGIRDNVLMPPPVTGIFVEDHTSSVALSLAQNGGTVGCVVQLDSDPPITLGFTLGTWGYLAIISPITDSGQSMDLDGRNWFATIS